MKITIKTEDEPKPQPVMKLFLVEEHGEIKLKGLDADGYDWYIAKFTTGGMVLFGGISNQSGWPVDGDGCIKVQKES